MHIAEKQLKSLTFLVDFFLKKRHFAYFKLLMLTFRPNFEAKTSVPTDMQGLVPFDQAFYDR